MRALISHNAKTDGGFAVRLSNGLRQLNFQPRIENLKAVCGEGNPGGIFDELRKKYDCMIAVLSRAYLRDTWLYNELHHAVTLDQTVRSEFIYPVLVSSCPVPLPLKDRIVDFRGRDFKTAFDELSRRFKSSRDVFVVMKYGDHVLDQFYRLNVRPVIESMGFTATRIDEINDSGSITDQILARIEGSAIVYSDLSGARPNCYFETGYAMALGKEVILTKRKGDDIHFDLSGRRYIEYEYEHQEEFKLKLGALLEAIKQNTFAGPSPRSSRRAAPVTSGSIIPESRKRTTERAARAGRAEK